MTGLAPEPVMELAIRFPRALWLFVQWFWRNFSLKLASETGALPVR